MSSPPITTYTAADVRELLDVLLAERALAVAEGLDDCPQYAAILQDEIAIAHAAYVSAAVSEIAALRGQLSGLLEG